MIDAAYESGVNFFDTANAYAAGRAEMILGEALNKYPRSSYVLATKVYWPVGTGRHNRGLSRRHILDQADASLKRLGVDHIDIFYCHWFDVKTPVEETVRAMDDLVCAGKIRYIGVSNWTAKQMSQWQKIARENSLHGIMINQPSYNMFDRYIEEEAISFCERNGIGLAVYSPLAQGLLAGKYKKGMRPPVGSRAANKNVHAMVTIWDYLKDDLLLVTEQLKAIADELDMTLSQLALGWALRQPTVSSVIIGASSPSQIRENCRASEIMLSDSVLERVERIIGPHRRAVKHNIVLGRFPSFRFFHLIRKRMPLV